MRFITRRYGICSRTFSLKVLTVEILSTWLFLNEKPHWLLPVCIDNEQKCSRTIAPAVLLV